MSPNGVSAMLESCVPGRARIRLPREQRQEEVIDHVKSVLEKINGVQDVLVNPSTGSFLVEYDSNVLDTEKIVRAGQEADLFVDGPEAQLVTDEAAISWGEPSIAGKQIIYSLRQLDKTVSRLSRGLVDGKTFFPLLLVGTSIGRALLSESRTRTPWYTLLWYGYSMFMHWNNPTRNNGK